MGRSTVYNPIVSEENLSKVNADNLLLLEEFETYMETVGRSETTIVNYDSDIKIFFVWLLEYAKNKFFVDITKKDIMFYQNYCMNVLKVGSARIRRMRSSVSSLANYVENILDDEYPNFRNPVNKIEAPPKQAVREKTVLSNEDIQRLLNYLIETMQYQKACVLALACASGARKTELLRFKVSYFDEKNIIYGSLYKTPEKIKTKGRGGKYLYKYTLKSLFKPVLDLWLEERSRLGIEIDDLFVIKKNDEWLPMKAHSLDQWVAQFSKILGVDFYWHSCRHYWTTSLSAAGIPDSIIKDLQGWESLEMCSIYNDIETDDKLAEFFGEEGIKPVEKKKLSDL